MLSIIYRKNDKDIGLIIEPESGSKLEINQYDELLKIIKKIYDKLNKEEEKNLINNFLIDDNGYYIKDIMKNEYDLLDNIRLNLNTYITEKTIVIQNFKNPPNINHRVFYFKNEENKLIVKFFELGEFNNIEYALELLNKIY